ARHRPRPRRRPGRRGGAAGGDAAPVRGPARPGRLRRPPAGLGARPRRLLDAVLQLLKKRKPAHWPAFFSFFAARFSFSDFSGFFFSSFFLSRLLAMAVLRGLGTAWRKCTAWRARRTGGRGGRMYRGRG